MGAQTCTARGAGNPVLRAAVGFVTAGAMKRTAIVTGGGKRVGAGIVTALIDDGWRVFAHVHHDADGVPYGAIKVVADLADESCASAIFDLVDGPVDMLVNSAARFAWDGFGEASAAAFDAHMAVNARAPMLLIDALAQRHRPGDRALVVNILDAKLSAPNPDFLSYTLSKYAAAGLTEVAARALAGKGIRVNAIAPALMLPSGEQDEDNFERVHALNPLGRGVAVDDVVAAIHFLAGQPAMTGQTLVIDGGQRFMALARDVQFVEQ